MFNNVSDVEVKEAVAILVENVRGGGRGNVAANIEYQGDMFKHTINIATVGNYGQLAMCKLDDLDNTDREHVESIFGSSLLNALLEAYDVNVDTLTWAVPKYDAVGYPAIVGGFESRDIKYAIVIELERE